MERKMHWHRWEILCLPKSMGGMGFRDLKCFNQALLAKQGWRLVSSGPSLLHDVMKARYFKHSSFMEANRGYDPSFSWRSIWGAKGLLLDGLKWRVGNGSQIKVWEDAWMPGEGTHIVPTPKPNSNLDLRVSELINHECGCWDNEALEVALTAEDRQTVLQLPLSSSLPRDSRFWWPERHGNYTVKTGYWLGRLGCLDAWKLLNGGPDLELWRLVWNLGGPRS